MARISLAPRHLREGQGTRRPDIAQPLLDPRGPRVVLGVGEQGEAPAVPIQPAANALFGPRGAFLAGPAGPLFVCDTGHHRLLIWKDAPARDNATADFVIGQQDFASEGRNGGRDVDAATLNVPTSVAFGGGILAVADAWNHRVLLWRGMPARNNQPADIVLGQANFYASQANRGMSSPRADTLNWCYGVAIHDGRLLVADTGNRRILIWNAIPAANGMSAERVLGQRDFVTRDENAGADVGAAGMRWPHGVAADQKKIFVADAGNNRVMAWGESPSGDGVSCDFVLGQSAFASSDHNRAAYEPSGGSLNMPYGAVVCGGQLVVADTANSRLLGFDMASLAMGAQAACVTGQDGFKEKGDNRWRPPARDSLCWPYGVSACDTTLVIADSGNNRVLLWELA